MSERIKKMETVLAKLKKVDLREYWAHEAHDFTRWLAHEENIQLLSEELSLSLTDVKTEEAIGRYKVDLVAFDEGTQKKVIIENQLEATDHKHLGQIITYASGYNADVIIWIVKDILAEHQKAIEWLNNNTSSSLSFFLIQMELWQIGDSALAPKFHVIVEPNSWAKEIQNTGNTPKEYTETKLVQLDFWEKFISYGKAQKTKMNLNRKPKPQHWYNLSFGTAKAYLHLTINTKDSLIGTGIYIANSEELYGVFESQKKSIEQDMEVALEWLPLEDKKASRIKTETEADISDEDSWHTYFQWLIATTEKIADAFGKYL